MDPGSSSRRAQEQQAKPGSSSSSSMPKSQDNPSVEMLKDAIQHALKVGFPKELVAGKIIQWRKQQREQSQRPVEIVYEQRYIILKLQHWVGEEVQRRKNEEKAERARAECTKASDSFWT